MKKYKNHYSKKLPQGILQKEIIKILKKDNSKSFSQGNLIVKIQAQNTKESFKDALNYLTKKGMILSDQNDKYSWNKENKTHKPKSSSSLFEGKIDSISSGAAYVITESLAQDIYVPEKHLNGALNRDRVIVKLTNKRFKRPEGKVVEVLERFNTRFIGEYIEKKSHAQVKVYGKGISLNVNVSQKDNCNAQSGDKVVVEINSWESKNLAGKVISVFKEGNELDIEMTAILINNGFEIGFPPEVIEESKSLYKRKPSHEDQNRRDLRELTTFTIDPVDAKDFDDAISIQKLDEGKIEIGVHIADVTYYVTEGSQLDKEAEKRATSVYLVDRVCPMLPEIISNDLCSLRPNEDKRCFSAIFVFDTDGVITEQWYGKTLIHSNHRFSYDEVQDILDQEKGQFSEELALLNNTAKQLNVKRFKEGSINFDSDEVLFVLDDKKYPVGVLRKKRKDAHKLVEEFMLLANKRVSVFVSDKKNIPFIYRVHDLPDTEKLQDLALLASEFGLKLKMDTPNNIKESLNLLSEIEQEKPFIANILKPMAIRSMAKAAYSSDNIGHYGLGFTKYTHFTSPIRRYADVLAHRILDRTLLMQGSSDIKTLEEKCKHISIKERNAIDSERESIKYFQLNYLKDKVGVPLDGMIRNIIDKGIFVELSESMADGFIAFSSMDVKVQTSRIKATSRDQEWKIGDQIKVEITKINFERRQIDLSIV